MLQPADQITQTGDAYFSVPKLKLQTRIRVCFELEFTAPTTDPSIPPASGPRHTRRNASDLMARLIVFFTEFANKRFKEKIVRLVNAQPLAAIEPRCPHWPSGNIATTPMTRGLLNLQRFTPREESRNHSQLSCFDANAGKPGIHHLGRILPSETRMASQLLHQLPKSDNGESPNMRLGSIQCKHNLPINAHRRSPADCFNEIHQSRSKAPVASENLLDLQRCRQVAVLKSPISDEIERQPQANQDQGIDRRREHPLWDYLSKTPRSTEPTL